MARIKSIIFFAILFIGISSAAIVVSSSANFNLVPSSSSKNSAASSTRKVYYLSPSGKDTNAGTIKSPWRTISFAAGKMNPGDVCYLMGGSYSGAERISFSGKPGAPLTFSGYAKDSVLLFAPPTSATEDVDTIRVYGSFVTLNNLKITNKNNVGQGIWISYDSRNVIVSNSEVYGARGQGILVSGDNNYIYKNSVHDNGARTPFDHGIYIEGKNNIIKANRVFRNWTYGIQLYREEPGVAGGNTVENNYIYGNGFGASGADPSAPSAGIVIAYQQPNNIIRNNIICGNAQYGIYSIDSQPGNSISGNITCYNGQGGIYLKEPGHNNFLAKNISFNDRNFAISENAAVYGNNNLFYSSSTIKFVFKGSEFGSLQEFSKASGQENNSRVENPKFANPPSAVFELSKAGSYNFCNNFNKIICSSFPRDVSG